MEYLISIMWYMGWPAIIFIAYYFVKKYLKKMDYVND